MKFIVITLVALATTAITHAQRRADIDPQRLSEMRTRIEEAANRIAAEYGSPPFSIIVSNEGSKADWVRERLNSLRKADVSEASLKDVQSRLAAASAELAAKESAVASATAKLKGIQLDTENARKEAQMQAAAVQAAVAAATPRNLPPPPSITLPAQPVNAPAAASRAVDVPIPTPPPSQVRPQNELPSSNGGIEEAIRDLKL